MDLTDKISDTVKNQMATAEATGTIDGKIYSVQQSVLPGGIWYSKDLFEKAGITETPKTWDEFKTVVQKLKDAGITDSVGPVRIEVPPRDGALAMLAAVRAGRVRKRQRRLPGVDEVVLSLDAHGP